MWSLLKRRRGGALRRERREGANWSLPLRVAMGGWERSSRLPLFRRDLRGWGSREARVLFMIPSILPLFREEGKPVGTPKCKGIREVSPHLLLGMTERDYNGIFPISIGGNLWVESSSPSF
jgi:hypothetical protein